MSNDTKNCQVCGALLREGGIQSLCPKCMLGQGLTLTSFDGAATSTDSGEPLADHGLGTVRYFGDYELLEEVARGGMGVIYKARQRNLNRVVALKMILSGALASESEVKRFQTEAESAANLQHPNIVAVHEVGLHDGLHYFSMDFVEGANLAEVLSKRKFSPMEVAVCVKQIADAIHYAHQRGTLHRDLKPQNVLIDAAGSPRITDFGLARKLESDSRLTRTGSVLGSPAYMAPEQAAGHLDKLGPQSDVYALGAIIYQMLTGHPPFRAETMMATLRQVIETPPIPPSKTMPGIPKDLETICLKCLEKQPERRYASARMLSEELERFLTGEPVHARAAGAARKAWSWMQRHPWALAGAVSMVLLVTVMVSFGLWQQNRYLLWKLKNPGVAHVNPTPPLFVWAGEHGMTGKILVGWGIATLLLSGPLLFGDFISRKARQFAFKPAHLVAYSIGGGVELLLGLGLVMMFVTGMVWDEIPPSKMGGSTLLALLCAFPFCWFGSNLIWCAVQEQRYLDFGSSKALPAEVFAKSPKKTGVDFLMDVYRYRYQTLLLLYLFLGCWIWRSLEKAHHGGVEVFMVILVAVMGSWAMANAFWTKRHASRHYSLLAMVFFGCFLAAILRVSYEKGTFLSHGLLPIAVGVVTMLILKRMGRLPCDINSDEFRAGRNGTLLWTELHPNATLKIVLALSALTFATPFLNPDFRHQQPIALFILAILPGALCEFHRSSGQTRQSRAVGLGVIVFFLVPAAQFNSPPYLLILGPIFLAAGVILVTAQVLWEKRYLAARNAAKAGA